MKLTKAQRRDKKLRKRRYGQRSDGKSVFVIQEQLIKNKERHERTNKSR